MDFSTTPVTAVIKIFRLYAILVTSFGIATCLERVSLWQGDPVQIVVRNPLCYSEIVLELVGSRKLEKYVWSVVVILFAQLMGQIHSVDICS